jgi:hypothetical protein
MASPVRRIARIAAALAASWVLLVTVAPLGSATPASADAPERPTAYDSLLAAPAMRPDLLERAVLERNPTLAAAVAAAAEASARADAHASTRRHRSCPARSSI